VAHITNFIRNKIDEDIQANKNDGKVITRFPPEPNGYLHIGHAKAICINFGIAQDYKRGPCYLRMDDTNPLKEDQEYIDAIKADVAWLGFDWGDHFTYASDYFDIFYDVAIKLIKEGKAYVCSLNAEQMREYRGTLTEPGKNSPDRDRTVEENLNLFERMKAGEFADGQYTLRAKIDMSASNINLRDPALYRIRKAHHHRTGDTWCIYPMYDFAHALEDTIEHITHSLCSLEFQDHRPLYNWFVEHSGLEARPQQIEFSRLNLNYTVTSKRKLKQLVDEKHVTGWDDPRMPTLAGARRRGFTPRAIRSFIDHVGVSKVNSTIDFSILEQHVRDDLNTHAERRMAVLDPIEVIISNYPDNESEMLSVANHPQNEALGRRELPFSKRLYIEREDFDENPPKGFHRLTPETPARLLNAYVIECQEIIKNEQGKVTQLICRYLPETLGGKKPEDGRKIKGIIHWLSADHAVDATVRLYDRLFKDEDPGKLENFLEAINPDSLDIKHAKVEASLAHTQPEAAFQFNRLGYFCADRFDHSASSPCFNKIVGLRDTWQNKV